MGDFIDFKADDVDGNVIGKFDLAAQTVSNNEFIDDETQVAKNIEDYYAFANVSRTVDDAMQDSLLEWDNSESQHEMNNYCNDNYDPNSEQYNNFRDSAKQFEEFKHTLLCPHGLENQDSFYYAILYTIHYQFKNKKDECQNEGQLKEDLRNDQLYNTLSNLKENLRLHLHIQKFENQCRSVNELLNKNVPFLRVYELKDKFCYLIKQNSEKKTFLRELSSCVIKKFNGLNIFRVEFSENVRQPFTPIDIIYKPVKNSDNIANCFLAKS